MPRKFLRKLVPSLRDLPEGKRLRSLFGALLANANLWHLNRYSVAWGVSVGLFTAFIPVPFQMVLAATAAIVIGCNLPIAVVLVWISNPVTMPPMFFAAYKFGAWLMDSPSRVVEFEVSIHWLLTKLGDIWEPFLLGCLLLGLIAAAIGHGAVRIIWRIHVTSTWRERRFRRLLRRKVKKTARKPGEP